MPGSSWLSFSKKTEVFEVQPGTDTGLKHRCNLNPAYPCPQQPPIAPILQGPLLAAQLTRFHSLPLRPSVQTRPQLIHSFAPPLLLRLSAK